MTLNLLTMKIRVTMTRLRLIAGICCAGVAAMTAASCTGLIFDDRDGCEHGVFLNFKYDYNLQRADLFGDHVGEVTVYVFDAQGRYVSSQAEGGDALAEDGYRMYLDLPEGDYQFIALAQQCAYDGDAAQPGAQFLREEPGEGDSMEDLAVELECIGGKADGYTVTVNHEGQPLDTLWHGISQEAFSVPASGYAETGISLMRNTKSVTVVMRDIDHPEDMNVEDYDFRIVDHNRRILYDNTVDESSTVLYTPYATWTTYDRQPSSGGGNMAHAEFMTSRIIYHDDPADDARLTVTEKSTGRTVIDVDLPDLLSRMANYDELQRYTPQEFLDRGYDYDLTFFLSGGSWSYVTINIGVLGWSKRIQNVEI